MNLYQLPLGKNAVITKIDLSQIEISRLNDFGLIENKKVTVVRKALFGDPIEILVGQVYLVIRKSQALKIEVSV